MSDDEADPELLELLRQRLGISRPNPDEISPDTGVLRDAEYIYNNAIDVSVDMYGTKAAASEIYKAMQERSYSTETWSQHELHPKPSEGFSELDIVNFIFTMDMLNFSFWSELSSHERFQVEYRGQRWTGYNSLVACLRRALDDGIPITTPRFWTSPRCTGQTFRHVFRSATSESIPLLEARIESLRKASNVLRESFADDEDEDEEADFNAGHEEEIEASHTPTVTTPEHSQSTQETSSGANDTHESVQDEAAEPTTNSEHTSATTQSHLDQASHTHAQPEIGSTSGDTSVSALPPSSEPNSNITSTPSGPLQNGAVSEIATADAADAAEHGPPPEVEVVEESALPDIRPADFRPDHAVVRLIEKADHSAGKLVNLLVKDFSCFRDESRFDGRRVRLLKRAQIFVADLWAALNGSGLGQFHDIDHLTMFADYRVPQSLHSLGVLVYSPPLDYHIRNLRPIDPGHSWEVQLRGCSIWAVELIRREILKNHPEETTINAVLIDFFLYDIAKEKEVQGQHAIPHHRTRSIWY